MSNDIIKILVPAVGGQGGGVMSEWLFQAFMIDGFEVQGVSLPGMSQRGGSTVYYLEAYNKKSSEDKVVFSQHPVPGDIDLILSQEFLELGRILERGFGSEKTTIVSSTHRIYSTNEKLSVSSGIYSQESLNNIANEFSSAFIGIDALEIAKNNEMNELAINSILLGILCATNKLPLTKETFIKSIEEVGVAVGANLKAFEIGFNYVAEKSLDNEASQLSFIFNKISSENLNINEKERKKLENLIESIDDFPNFLRELLIEALIRITDYQSISYAKKYLSKLKKIYEIDKKSPDRDFQITEEFLKNLALLMTYEDGIRVAELKIRQNRFKNIKKEMNIKEDQVFKVIDYLKPDAEELYGLLPNIFVSPFVKENLRSVDGDYSSNNKQFTVSQRPTTTALSGFLLMWFLSKIKFIRPSSHRYNKEHQLINEYAEYVEKFTEIDYDLGLIIAKAGDTVKGYGRVRRRTMNSFYRFLANVVDKIYDLEKFKETKPVLTIDIAERSLKLISENEDGINEAEKLSAEALK